MLREFKENFGKRQPDQNAEKIPVYGYDTLLFAKDGNNDYAVIKRQQIFNPADKKLEHLKSNDFPLLDRPITITGMSVTHNIKLSEPKRLPAFEQLAKIKVNINDVDYSDIPLATLLRYNRIPVGSETAAWDIISKVSNVATDPVSPADGQVWYNTASKELKLYVNSTVGKVVLNAVQEELNALQEKGGNYSVLADEIDLPVNGKIKLTFDPSLENLVTTSIAKDGVDIANDGNKYFYIIIAYFGYVVRER